MFRVFNFLFPGLSLKGVFFVCGVLAVLGLALALVLTKLTAGRRLGFLGFFVKFLRFALVWLVSLSLAAFGLVPFVYLLKLVNFSVTESYFAVLLMTNFLTAVVLVILLRWLNHYA